MVQVFVSSVINAPINEVWLKIRDFNALPEWHPAIAESYIENGDSSDRISCVRNFKLKDGGNIRERLLALSDMDRLCTYSILDSPMPVTDYIATLRLLPITNNKTTYAEWTARFNCSPEEENNLTTLIGTGVFQSGFDTLNKIFIMESANSRSNNAE